MYSLDVTPVDLLAIHTCPCISRSDGLQVKMTEIITVEKNHNFALLNQYLTSNYG